MLGLDATLWRDSHSETGKPVDIKAGRKSVQDSDDPFIPFDSCSLDASGICQHYGPPIRRTMNYANKDEVRMVSAH